VLRWALVHAFPTGAGFPWTVLAINVGGSALLGLVLAEEWTHPRARLALHDAAGIGFCGGFTTFSTFAVEVAVFLHEGRLAVAATYTGASVVGCIGAALIGAGVLRRVRALDLPLEAEP
jgi:fluoride exporter